MLKYGTFRLHMVKMRGRLGARIFYLGVPTQTIAESSPAVIGLATTTLKFVDVCCVPSPVLVVCEGRNNYLLTIEILLLFDNKSCRQ
jgi:hypothetical protein